jgi:hypothetical protein
MNLCQVYVPLVHQKPNDSTRWSFDSRDMRELERSKEAYKRFVEVQAESLEFIMAEFSKEDTTNDGEVSSFLNLMA